VRAVTSGKTVVFRAVGRSVPVRRYLRMPIPGAQENRVKTIAALALAAAAVLAPAAHAQPVSIRIDTPEFGVRVGNIGYGAVGYPVPVYPAPVYAPPVVVAQPLPVYPVPVYVPPRVIVPAPVYGQVVYPYAYGKPYRYGHPHKHHKHHKHGNRYIRYVDRYDD
jgi:hypothetical protein